MTATAAPAPPSANGSRTKQWKVAAYDGAQAWLNAAIASGQDADRGALYRTLRIEFFEAGIQFIGCDGTMIFRTWASYSDAGDLPAPQPPADKLPKDSVTVLDIEKFAVGFMRTLLAATAGENTRMMDLEVSIDPAEEEQAALSEEIEEYVLTLHALGQRLSCKLYEGQFPNWRGLELGLDSAELVDGMTLAPRMFAAIGKLKGVAGVDLEFRGRDRAIDWRSMHLSAPCRGLLMPMRKPTDRAKSPKENDGQMEHK